jgi:hypothetical protein
MEDEDSPEREIEAKRTDENFLRARIWHNEGWKKEHLGESWSSLNFEDSF